MADRFIFESELLFKSNGEQFVREVRTIFRQLADEAKRSISFGTTAGISPRFAAAQGQIASIINAKPGLSDRQTEQAYAALRGSKVTFAGLQREAEAAGLVLRNISTSGVDRAYIQGTRLIQETLQRQSNAKLREAEASEKLAAAERRAATEAERQATLNAQRGTSSSASRLYGPPAPAPGSRYGLDRPIYGPPAPADRPTYGPPAPPAGSRFNRGADQAVLEAARALQVKGDLAREQTASKEYLQAKARTALAERERSAAIARATREEAVAQGLGGGTFFQRLQSAVHARGGFGGAGGGAGGDSRLPSDFQSFGQFLTSKAVTTGGFALSGAILYGTISGFKEIIREASALQRELAIVKSQFDALGDSAGFERFSKQMVAISVETGVAADQAARVARQLAGVFRIQQPDGRSAPDFEKAAHETQQALKLSQVTGLPYQEITDSLTALTVTFGTSFTQIGDQAIGLEQRLGVLSTELIRFAADVAPVAKTFGLTFEQLIGLGAIAQQRSGISGGALAENLNRSLPSIQKSQVGLAQLLGQRAETRQFTAPLLDAIGAAEGGKAIEQLALAYAKMTDNQRQALGDLLGGQKNAKAFFAILEGGQDTLDVLGGKLGNFGGALDDRFKDFQSTVEFAFERARRALEAFGLALFNSGLADGLKLVADAGADVAKVAAVLLGVFSQFNDLLGGLPIKLLAVYTTLRLITALGGGIGGLRALVTGVRGGVPGVTGGGGGGVPASLGGLGFISASPAGGAGAASALPYATTGLFGRSVAASGTQRALSSFATTVAPAVAALAVAQVLQTVQQVRQQTDDAIKNFDTKVADLLKQGVDANEIVRQIKSAGGGSPSTLSQILNFGSETNVTTEGINEVQRAHAKQQGEELGAILKNADAAQRERIAKLLLDQPDFGAVIANILATSGTDPDLAKRLAQPGKLELVVKQFLNDPANNTVNDAVARLIEFARSGGASPEVIQELLRIADQYAKTTDQGAAAKAVTDYAPVLAEVKARFEVGDASLQELLSAEHQNIELIKEALAHATGASIATAATELAAAQKDLDQIITTASQRAADITTRLAGIRGLDVSASTVEARLQQLHAAVSQGASPDVQLNAALDVLDAQQKALEQFINSPVIVNGIARAPTEAQKLARATQGVDISPEVREAVIRGGLSTGASLEAVKALASAKGLSVSQAIDLVTSALLSGDQGIIAGLNTAIDLQIENLKKFAKSSYFHADQGAIDRAIASLNQARSLIGGLDPGTKVKGSGIMERVNATAVEASNEAKAFADALIAQQRAQAHGDPIASAQAAIAQAQNAIHYAGTPSERANAVAQLIDAQNQLEDAQVAALESAVSLTQALTSDPVTRAQLELQKAQIAVDNAHGVAARNDALARQAEAQRTLNEAIVDVFRSQQELVAAIADAAGDVVASAEAQLAIAQRNLSDLLARKGAGDDPGDAAINRARAQVAQSQAAVRDAELRQRSQDIDVALQLERITTAQAIAQFQALLQIPNLTVEETNQILLKIKQLKDSLSQDFASNIPSEIHVPTLYEARRLNSVGTPGGPQSYQDNRNIQINLQAYNQGDLTEAVDTMVAVIDSRPRNGPRAGEY